MSLSSQLASRSRNLRKVTTRVTSADGRVFHETNGEVLSLGETALGFVADLEPDLQVGRISDRLFIGSQDVASDVSLLTQYGITHILSVAPVDTLRCPSIDYLVVPVVDLPEEQLSVHFPACFGFIERGIRAGRVLVHCNAGVSRSTAVIIAYLMYRHQRCLAEALRIVKIARPCAKPNEGFLKQLQLYEQHLHLNG